MVPGQAYAVDAWEALLLGVQRELAVANLLHVDDDPGPSAHLEIVERSEAVPESAGILEG